MRICFLAHKALPSNTRCLLLSIVFVVIIAAARRNIKMLGTRTQGLVVEIRRHHRRCCGRRCRCTMRYENSGRSRPRPLPPSSPPRWPCHRHLSSSLPLLLLSLLRDEMYMPWALALRILSSTYVVAAAVINSSCACAWWLINSSCACAQWLMDSSCAWAQWLMDSLCACARWLIACIVVCCRRRTTTQNVKWRSCACAWVAWCRHMMLLQPICCHCSCHRMMQYDNMVCLHTISYYSLSLLCDTGYETQKGRGVDNICCSCTHIVLAVVVTWCLSLPKLVIVFAFEQIGSLLFYHHSIQLIVDCHYDDSQYMKHSCACTWVASCWHMLLSQHYCCCCLWETRSVIATVRLAQLL